MTLPRETVLAGLESEFAQFAELVRDLDDAALNQDTRCAGWTVRDVAGHVVGTVVDVSQGRIEGQGSPAVTERQARERAGRSAAELADELTGAASVVTGLLASFPTEAWDGPSLNDPSVTLGFAIEAMWYDAFVHGNDIREAVGQEPEHGEGLRCAVHHVAGYLDQRGWKPTTLRLSGMEDIHISGGGPPVEGDPLDFVLAATGRVDPTRLGLDPAINVYAPNS